MLEAEELYTEHAEAERCSFASSQVVNLAGRRSGGVVEELLTPRLPFESGRPAFERARRDRILRPKPLVSLGGTHREELPTMCGTALPIAGSPRAMDDMLPAFVLAPYEGNQSRARDHGRVRCRARWRVNAVGPNNFLSWA